MIPILSESKFCYYKYTIPEGYKFLGSQENLLKKESDKLFTYQGECPKESKSDFIRFSPEQSMWKADTVSFLKSSEEFKNSVNIKFPRFYRGGKNINSYYIINSTEGQEFNENKIISNYINLTVEIPPANKNQLGIEVHNAFTNKLSNKFDVYFPEGFYQFDEKNLDPEIKAKAQEIINNKEYYPGYENYYKLGKFVHNYMTYDLSYYGKNFSPKEIYNQKAGICEHYTILYNEMLNSIGIKTLYVYGWAFQNDETSGNKDTTGHAWTVALIDDNWIELDATWGLFEGISAGHILKGFFKTGASFTWKDKIDATIEENPNIVLLTDNNELKDPSNPNENNEKNTEKPKDETTNTSTEKITDDDKNEKSTEKPKDESTNGENNNEKKTESDNTSDKKEEEEVEDTIQRFRPLNKSNMIKISLITLFLFFWF